MAATILWLLREPEMSARLASKARREAELFQWSRVLPFWEALLAEVGGEAGRT